MNIFVVVPTIRPETLPMFLQAWSDILTKCSIILVEDNPQRSGSFHARNVTHLCWEDVDNELGSNSWIVPRRTDCIRSFGFYYAIKNGADIVVTIDDDCYPKEVDFIDRHVSNLTRLSKADAWISTGLGILPRGFPYRNFKRTNECVVSHGLWDNNPDFDAVTELYTTRSGGLFEPVNQVIPAGKYFPFCGMNVAFKRQIAPAVYFLGMGEGCPFDRFGDIWCGVLVKKICDHLGYSIWSGDPRVEHRRASNVWRNLAKEAPAYEVNETFWESVDRIRLTRSTVRECYKEIANVLDLSGEYWRRVRNAMAIWAEIIPD